jgi:hypothetical protein
MKSPEAIEAALHRLAPTDLSHRAKSNVSSMLSDLAAKSITSSASRPPLNRSSVLSWSAAAVVLLSTGTIVWSKLFPTHSPPAVAIAPQASLIDSSKQIPPAPPMLVDRLLVTDAPTVEKTIANTDGFMIQQVKRSVHSHERYRDAQKGYLITISETHHEKVYLPQNDF